MSKKQPPLVKPPSNLRLRRMALHRQGLMPPHKLGRGKRGVERALERIGYAQIDTISVVARAHHHVLYSRVADYSEEHLHQLLTKRRIFEYWHHAAAYRPIDHFRYALPMMRGIESGEIPWFFKRKDEKARDHVLARIREEGPLYARDFEDPRRGKNAGWWDWKPAKKALEQLFLEGALTVVERNGFQKRFELTERFLPGHVDASEPSPQEHADYEIDATLDAHGFTTRLWITHGRRRSDKRLKAAITEQLKQRTGEDLAMFKLPNGDLAWARAADLTKALPRPSNAVAILSPFDNTVIQRDRGRLIFDFDYTIECYVPEAQRRFGYFVLPIVFGDDFCGRMDCKAHRKERRFEIKSLFIEREVPEAFFPAFGQAVRDYAAFTGCDEVVLGKVTPKALTAPVRQVLA